MRKTDERYQAYINILKEELIPAMGCTEPIALAYAAAVGRKTLGELPDKVVVEASGSIIKNAKSSKMGKKDILKIECEVGTIDLDIIGFVDHNITVNIIKDEQIVEKKVLQLPKQIKNVIRCKNPRCITSIEQELDQIFYLTDPEKEVYRCKYCETKYKRH